MTHDRLTPPGYVLVPASLGAAVFGWRHWGGDFAVMGMMFVGMTAWNLWTTHIASKR